MPNLMQLKRSTVAILGPWKKICRSMLLGQKKSRNESSTNKKLTIFKECLLCTGFWSLLNTTMNQNLAHEVYEEEAAANEQPEA